MSWIEPDASGRWTKRTAATVTGGAGGSQYTNLDLSELGDYFWDNVDSSGDSIRVTSWDGETLVNYQLNSWDSAARTGDLDIAQLTYTASVYQPLWVYFGSLGTPAAGTTTVTASSPATATFHETDQTPSGFVTVYSPPRPGASLPRDTFVKSASGIAYVWWNVSRALHRRRQAYNLSYLGEEIQSVGFQVLAGGADQATMYDNSKIRILAGGWVRTQIKAGSSGTDYTLSLTVNTTHGQTLNPRALLKVKTVAES